MYAGAAVIHHHWTHAQDQGTSFAGSPTAPHLDDFTEVLESLAKRYAVVNDNAPDWVRGSSVAAGSKLQALRFMLQHSSPRSQVRLLDMGSQIGSLPLHVFRFGIRTAGWITRTFPRSAERCCANVAWIIELRTLVKLPCP